MSRFDQIREAAIQRIVAERLRQLVSRTNAILEIQPTADNPLGVASLEIEKAITAIHANVKINYHQAAAHYVDAKLVNFLSEGS